MSTSAIPTRPATAAISDAVTAPIEDCLRRFILTELTGSPLRRLASDTPLFESLLDSTSVLALVSFIEQQYPIEILDSEIVPAHFSTLRQLAAFVAAKLQPTQLAAAN